MMLCLQRRERLALHPCVQTRQQQVQNTRLTMVSPSPSWCYKQCAVQPAMCGPTVTLKAQQVSFQAGVSELGLALRLDQKNCVQL